MQKKVSVIVTTHNRVVLLQRAIESALNQDYPNIEVIVVDDASTDSTKAVCESYPVKYIGIDKTDSKGGNYARNLGVFSSSGYYCAFLDDDDYWLPTKISRQVQLIEEKHCDFVGCGMTLELVKKDNSVTFLDKEIDPWLEGDISKKVMIYIPTNTSALLVKKSALFSIGLWDESMRFWQDYDLMVRLAQKSPFYYVREHLLIYRINPTDVNRLTNKFFDWKTNTRNFRIKHVSILARLNMFEKLLAKTLVWRDGYKRSKVCGLRLYSFVYIVLCTIFFLPFIVYKKMCLK